MSKRKSAMKISSLAMALVTAILAAAFSLTFTGCDEKAISPKAQNFVNHVMRIKTPISLESEAEIEAGYVLYAYVGDEDKEDAAVREHKQILDRYKSEYDVLRAAKDEEEESAAQSVMIERFVNAVSQLPSVSNINSDNMDSVRKNADRAFELYERLNGQSREDSSVKYAYKRLTDTESALTEIENEQKTAQIAAAAQEFIDGVEAIGKVTLESINDIEDLLYNYESFSEEVKAYEGVAEAKQTLDAAFERYSELKDADDVSVYKDLAASLSPAETAVTLQSERDILKAEALYEEMSERAKAADGVSEARELISAAREKYDELFAVAEAERVSAFVAAANKVPTDIENVNIGWFDVLDAASRAYGALESYDSYNLPEVQEAFNRWNTAQTEFDKKGYERIPMTDPNILFSGDMPPHIVLQMEENMLKPLREFFGVASTGALDSVAIIWLHVYIDGNYQGKVTLQASDLSHIIANSKVVDALKRLSVENENVVSGARYSFALSVADKENKYIPSASTKVSVEKVYTWVA